MERTLLTRCGQLTRRWMAISRSGASAGTAYPHSSPGGIIKSVPVGGTREARALCIAAARAYSGDASVVELDNKILPAAPDKYGGLVVEHQSLPEDADEFRIRLAASLQVSLLHFSIAGYVLRPWLRRCSFITMEGARSTE